MICAISSSVPIVSKRWSFLAAWISEEAFVEDETCCFNFLLTWQIRGRILPWRTNCFVIMIDSYCFWVFLDFKFLYWSWWEEWKGDVKTSIQFCFAMDFNNHSCLCASWCLYFLRTCFQLGALRGFKRLAVFDVFAGSNCNRLLCVQLSIFWCALRWLEIFWTFR